MWVAHCFFDINEVLSVIDKGNGTLIYPEGGRSYGGGIKKELNLGTLRKLVNLGFERDLLAVPVFVKYDKRKRTRKKYRLD